MILAKRKGWLGGLDGDANVRFGGYLNGTGPPA